MNVLRHAQPYAGMPASAVEHEDDLLGGAGADGTSERGELDFKDRNTDRRRQMEDGLSGGGMDKADEIAPGEAMPHQGNGALTDRCPHPPEQRFEADAVFIDGPEVDLRVRKGRGDCS